MSTQAFPADAVNLFIGTASNALSGNMSVTMKTNKYYLDGNLLRTGQTYSVTREWGRTAVDKSWAADTNEVLPVLGAPALGASGAQLTTEQAASVAASGALDYYPEALFPSLSVTDAIIATAASVAVIGAGRVMLPQSTVASPITLTATLPLYSGVKYVGAGGGFDLGVTTGTTNYNGTVLQGNGTFPAFSYNATDGVTPPASYAAFLATFLTDGGVSDVVVKNFSFGVKCGALYQGGCQGSIFKNIFAISCGWGFWFENQILNRFENLNGELCTRGIGAFIQSAGTTVLNSGNSFCTQLFGEINTILGRGWCFWARGALVSGFLNDMVVNDIQVNRARLRDTQAVTMANGSPNITVADGSKYAVDLPVSFSASVNGFFLERMYCVISVAGNVIQVANKMGGTAISATGNIAVNCIHDGFPCVEWVGFGNNGIQPSFCEGIDTEGGATTRIYIQQASGLNLGMGTCGGEEFTHNVKTLTIRESTYTIVTTSSAISHDIDNASITTDIRGPKTNIGAGAGGQTSSGMGLWLFAGSDPRYATNAMALSFVGQYGPEIAVNKNTGALEFSSRPIGYAYYLTVASGGTVPLHNLVVYSGAGGGNCTLPVIPANGEGVPVLLSNPSSGTLTVNPPSGQTINGLAAPVVMAANSAKQFCSVSLSGTRFWVAA